jgi:hypothetical protein
MLISDDEMRYRVPIGHEGNAMNKRRLADMIGCREQYTDLSVTASPPAARQRILARLAMSAMSNTVVRTQAVTALILQLRFDEVTRVAVAVGLAVGTAVALITLFVAACSARPGPRPDPGPHPAPAPARRSRHTPSGGPQVRPPRCAGRR